MITRDIQLAVDCLDKNDVVGMPTETVYGLAGNAFSEQAVRRIFEVKKRPSYNPLIVHINGTADLNAVATDIPEAAVVLTRHFWPGPLTVVLKKKSCIPDLVTAGKATVAVRAPDHPVAQELLRKTSYHRRSCRSLFWRYYPLRTRWGGLQKRNRVNHSRL